MGPVLKQLTVKTIEPILMDYTVNVSESILRDSLAHSVFDNKITDDTVADVVSTTMDALHQSAQFNPTAGIYTVQNSCVHCEALLLRYHLLNPEIPPFNYFAVSELCCYPCYALFHAYNELTGPGEHKYFTKGCHNKIYPSWPLPQFSDLKDSQIRSQLAQEHFVPELRVLLKNRQSIRASSDSTDASESSAGPANSIYKDANNYGMYYITCGDEHLNFFLSFRCYGCLLCKQITTEAAKSRGLRIVRLSLYSIEYEICMVAEVT